MSVYVIGERVLVDLIDVDPRLRGRLAPGTVVSTPLLDVPWYGVRLDDRNLADGQVAMIGTRWMQKAPPEWTTPSALEEWLGS